MNGLTDFKEYGVGQFKWVILATEHFAVPTDYTKINATKQLLRLREKGTRVVILNCMSKYVEYIMKQAERLDMLNEWVWILTDGAIAKEGSTKYKEGLIGVRYPQTGKGRLSGPVNKAWSARKEKTKIEGRTGRIFDAVLTIAYGVNLLRDNVTITDPPKGDSFCSSSNLTAQPWSLGEQFYNYLKEVKGDGFMHQIAYSPMGQPRARSFDIVNYQTEDGWVKVGYSIGLRVKLEKKRPVIWLNGGIEVPKLASLALKYKKLKVLIFESRPFVMAKTGNISTSDNKVLYEGFCIDLLEELKKKLSFDYELKLMKSFGEKQPDGSWDGILGDLTRGKADLAVSTFTISPEREKAVDFTQPYFSLGYKIVMKKAIKEKKSNLWGFLDPFELTLWAAIVVSSVVIGTVVWIYDRLSPYGYYGRAVQSKVPTEEEYNTRNTLCFFNSFWSATASYLEQGPDGTHPISHSGRATILAWWFAISIFGATYTANLAAFLTVNKYEHPIKSIEDLADQQGIAYGTAPGQLAEMLKTASLPVYEKLWRYIETHGTLEDNATYAIDKVRSRDDYAFIWDSAVLDYEVQSEPCNTLTIVGRPFGSINYGFALPLKSPYTQNFSVAMLELQQDGFLERMTEKWFRSRSKCGAETEAADAKATEGGEQLGFKDMAGVFITLLGGFICGVGLLIVEWIFASYKDTLSKDRRAPTGFFTALWLRLQRMWWGILSLCSSSELGREEEPKPKLRALVEEIPLSHRDRKSLLDKRWSQIRE
ncbi:glutamate receptor 1 isoform X2 [Nematostella vectensis]|nr:glutamate receptor 1 isoform X2 [Nematostella vectensis]